MLERVDFVLQVPRRMKTDDFDEDPVHAALEHGCTLIDTAALYGARRSEAAIGRALRERPDLAADCIVTTKAGRLNVRVPAVVSYTTYLEADWRPAPPS